MNKPNCLTCPHYIKDDKGLFWCDVVLAIDPKTYQCGISHYTKMVGCLSHPGAREYLMKDVITELKHKQANAHGEISHHFFDDDCYREGIIKTCIEAISLIRDGVKK